jgi:hypothetical protein
MVVNAVKPWLSTSDIESGARWSSEIAQSLESTQFGIICLTPKSLRSEWVIFEAGALSKTVSGTYVCPLLIDLTVSDVQGSLAQFQSRNADFDGIKKLVETMNMALGDQRIAESQITATVKALWPMLEEKLRQLPADTADPVKPKRELHDIAEETLGLIRTISLRQERSSQMNDLYLDPTGVYASESDALASLARRHFRKVGEIVNRIEGMRLSHMKPVDDQYQVSLEYKGDPVMLTLPIDRFVRGSIESLEQDLKSVAAEVEREHQRYKS